MRNTEVEKTMFIDMNRVAQDAGLLDEKDRWCNFGHEDLMKCITILENRISRDQPDVIQITGKFPIEVSMTIGAYLGQNRIKLEYCRPGIPRKEIFDFRECPELGFV